MPALVPIILGAVGFVMGITGLAVEVRILSYTVDPRRAAGMTWRERSKLRARFRQGLPDLARTEIEIEYGRYLVWPYSSTVPWIFVQQVGFALLFCFLDPVSGWLTFAIVAQATLLVVHAWFLADIIRMVRHAKRLTARV